MFEARNWISVACGLCVGLWAGCSNDGTTQPPAARGVEPPAAAPSGAPIPPGIAVPPGLSNAAGSMAIAPVKPGASPNSKPVPATEPGGLPIGPGAEADPNQPTVVRSVPTDAREVKHSPLAQPISGGTLVVTADDKLAIASDPERDRVSIVDLVGQRLLASIALEPGDEPGRLALDGAGRVHVALRRTAAVVSIDLATRKIVERRSVCSTPRGIAFESSSQRLVVACASGEIATLPVAGASGIEIKRVDADLRDVVVRPNGTFITRLKSAEVLALDAAHARVSTARPPVKQQFFSELDGSQTADTVEPVGARRTIATPDGLLMLHSGARNGDILVPAPSADGVPIDEFAGGKGGGGSAYGGAGGCSGVVSTVMTKFDAGGKVVATAAFPAALPVDIAHSAATGEIAVAIAGSLDPLQPTGGFFSVDPTLGSGGAPVIPPQPMAPVDGTGSVFVLGVARFNPATGADIMKPVGSCMSMTDAVALNAPATAVTYLSDGRLVVQTREPAAVYVAYSAFNALNPTEPIRIDLGGESVFDSGHEIFHRDAGAGLACASCHIEGGDDGHTWNFVDQGPRRTQSMLGGLAGAPFHWVGDMKDLGTLMEHVFVGRMGGVHQNPARLGALEQWMNSIKAPPPLRVANDPAVERGHELFVGEAECGKCHNGEKLTNNMTVDVGTGVALQVPSLVAIGYRSPWLHTGCAKTLAQRFDPACGGETHGRTAQLTGVQIDDLVAYLESL